MPPQYFYPVLGVVFVVSLSVLRTIRVALGGESRRRWIAASAEDRARFRAGVRQLVDGLVDGQHPRERGGAGDTLDGMSRADRVGDLQARVQELEERVDFAERLLAQRREREQLS